MIISYSINPSGYSHIDEIDDIAKKNPAFLLSLGEKFEREIVSSASRDELNLYAL